MSDQIIPAGITDTQEAHQEELDSCLSAIRDIISASQGIPGAVTVKMVPAEASLVMTAGGDIEVRNHFAIELNGVTATITQSDMQIAQDSGGNLQALLATRLAEIGALCPLNDAQLIRALLNAAGGEVQLTLEDVAVAKKASTIQFDGLKLTLRT